MKYIASCSFGKDSLAMVLKLLELKYPLDEVIYFNIGADYECIENNKNRLKEILQNKNILFTELKPEKDFFYLMLEKPVQKKNGETQSGYKWCGGVCRWGTALKTGTISKYLKKYENEQIIEYIGIASDEPQRIISAREKRNTKTVKIFPLAEWGMSEKDCLSFCYSRGWHWREDNEDLYNYLSRVSCWCCKNKNLRELENTFLFLPKYWQKLKDLQQKINMPFKENKTILDLENIFKEKYCLFTR